MLRWAAIWLALFAVYGATLGIPAFRAADYGGDEPHYLLTAESIVSDADVDLTDEYRDRAYRAFYPYALDVHGRPTNDRIHEPQGVGFPLLIAPAYALGAATAVELLLAAIAALGFVLAIALARRLVPEPWATAGPLVVALSPPALAYSTAVYPELAAGTALAGAALLALRARERPRARTAAACAALIALLPWLGTKYVPAGAVVLALLVRWLLRRERRLAALVAAEVCFASLVAFVSVNERLYGGLTPYAAEWPRTAANGAGSPGDLLDRAYRLVALWLDRDYGLLRWAPFLALAFLAAWLLWRSRRERLARAIADRADVEVAAGLLAAVCAAQLLVAAFLSPTMFGFWFPGRHLVAALPAAGALCAWGLRHAPRTGAVLAALTVGAGAWLYAELRLAGTGWIAPGTTAPWGPLEGLLPRYGAGSAWATGVTLAVAAALALLVLRARRHARQTAGSTRRAYSG